MYRDQLAAIYKYYLVTGVRIKATVVPNTTTSAPVAATAWFTQSTSGAGTIDQMYNAAERGSFGLRTATAVKPAEFSRFQKLHTVMGLTEGQYRSASNLTPVGSNPTAPLYFLVYASSMDSSSNAPICLQITMELDVEFSQLADVGPS